MTRTRLAPALALGAALAVATAGPAADIPPALQKGIDTGVAAYRDATKAADKALLDAITKEIEVTRKLTSLKAEQRQTVVQELTAEKDAFERDGTLPFSPRMRRATLDYLKNYNAAERPAEAAYDKAIDLFTKGKDDRSAADVLAEKKKVVAPRVVAVWACEGGNFKATFRWALRSDGTISGKNTWTLDKDKLVIINRELATAPPGGIHDVCTLSADGQRFNAKAGTAMYQGRLVEIGK